MAINTRTPSKPSVNSPKTNSKTISTVTPNVNFDPATTQLLNSNYGSEASWYNNPEVGPVLKAVLVAGKGGTALTGSSAQDFIKTHAVDPKTGKVIKVAPDQSWFGQHGAQYRTTLAQKYSDVGAYNDNVNHVLNAVVQPLLNTSGQKLSTADAQKIAEEAYTGGWTQDQVSSAISAQASYDPNAASGNLAYEQSKFSATMNEYGIPVPKDPTQLKAFQDNMQNLIQGSMKPGATDDAFTTYAKTTAKGLYPWMSSAIDAGVTPQQYLSPYITQVANTLDLPRDSVSITNPKWADLFRKPDPTAPGSYLPSTWSDVMQRVKTDPQYGYDYTTEGRKQGADFATGIQSEFGF
jgi:hypothetical protein